MASIASESSAVCSPTGSVLITRTPGGSASTFQFFTDFSQNQNEPAPLEESFEDVEDTLEIPTARNMKEPGDYIHWATVDPAVLRLTWDEYDFVDFDVPETRPERYASLDKDEMSREEAVAEMNHTPFHKWMRTLRRRAGRRQCASTIDDTLRQTAPADGLRSLSNRASHHRQSSSGSSFGFVEAVRTASVSLASGSVFSRSRRNSASSSRTQTHTDCSSRASISRNRYSEESAGLDKPQVLDKAAVERSLQRRRILEELISTEEGYIGDVRFLMNVSRIHLSFF